jgi:hypothetical protein
MTASSPAKRRQRGPRPPRDAARVDGYYLIAPTVKPAMKRSTKKL